MRNSVEKFWIKYVAKEKVVADTMNTCRICCEDDPLIIWSCPKCHFVQCGPCFDDGGCRGCGIDEDELWERWEERD
jgi:hypothetical protein